MPRAEAERGDDLARAVTAGVIDADTARRLGDFWRAGDSARADEEPVRLIMGFNDVFVVFAILLSLGGVFWFVGDAWALAAPVVAWGLSEIFVRRRRMALPGIVLAAAFVSPAILLWSENAFSGYAGLAGAALAALYYWRFRVPFSVALGALALVFSALSLMAGGSIWSAPPLAWLIAGFGLFALAMWRDLRDPLRLSLDADIAFWLHLAAAPMLVRSAMGLLGEGSGPGFTLVFWLVIALCWLVALVIDRRPIIVSSLAYVVAALAGWMGESSGGFQTGKGLAVLIAGLALLALSIWWRPIRRAVLSILPLGSLRRRLPPAGTG